MRLNDPAEWRPISSTRSRRDLIHADGPHRRSWCHNVGLDEAPDAYRHFDNRDDGWTKVVVHP